MKLSAILAPMVAAKVPHEVLLETVRAYELQQEDALEKRRASDRARQSKRRNNVTSRDVTVTVPSRGRVEVKTSSSDIEPQKKDISPQAELASVLTGDRADAVVAHRKRIGKPMTSHAAKLLAGKFAKCPDPNAAADAMVSNGWQGFEPEWMDRNQPRGSPAQRKTHLSDTFRDLSPSIGGAENGNDSRPSSGLILHLPSVGRG